MTRPLFVLGMTVLSGTLVGLAETKGMIKGSVCLLDTALVFKAYRKSRESKTFLLFCTLFLLLFSASFLRARTVCRELSGEEYRAFYEKYEATNPGEFDYALYLKSLNIRTEEERKALKDPDAGTDAGLLNRFHRTCSEVLSALMTEHDAGIYKAMLLGQKSDMDEEVKNLYQKAGISHLLAVSGLHVSLIGMGLFTFLKKRLCLSGAFPYVLASAATFLYAKFTGASGSALRASLMFSLSIFSAYAGRTYDSLTALSLACILLLFWRPYLVLQSGFQLSFLAIAGICISNSLRKKGVFCEKKERKLEGIQKYLSQLKSQALSSLCITLVTLPAVTSAYYSFPLYSVALNLIVIPLVSAVMISGISLLGTGLLSLLLLKAGWMRAGNLLGTFAALAVSPGHMILLLYEKLCDLMARIPFSNIVTGKPSPFAVILYSALLSALYYFLTRETKEQAEVLFRKVCAMVTLVISVVVLRTKESPAFYVAALDVSQGDCFHIHEGNLDILIDGGSQGYEKVGSGLIEPYFLSKGITDLDAVIVSHADADHVNGLYYLLSEASEVEVSRLILPALAKDDEKYDRLKDSFGKEENTVYARKGVCLSGEHGLKLSCVYCREEGKTEDTNSQSSVFLLSRGGFRMLFTGDITAEEERAIVREYKEVPDLSHINVLKVSHHGSKTASCNEFIDLTSPDYAVLSYKKGNSYGHPDEEVVERFTDHRTGLLRTAESGAVEIKYRNGRVEITPFPERERRGKLIQ